jgi:hypothetical protein
MRTTHPLTAHPGQIIGFRPARQHERPGRMYPIFAMAGGAPDDPPADPAPSDPAPTDPPANDPAPSPDPAPSDPAKWDGKVESLPQDVQKLIERYKNEAANASSKSRENARKEAEQELLKKLGLVKGDEKPNPDELAKQLTAAQQAQRQATVELAVYRTASKHQGDPNALLDSRSFLAKVADLDPSAKDFETKVSDAIKDAVANNQKLKAGQAPGKSSVDHGPAGGGNRSEKPKSLADAVAGHFGT